MPKIETPEEFVKRYTGEALSQKLYGLRVAVAARDEQYLALLKQCGEVLNKAYQAIACPEGTRAIFLLDGASLDIRNALAALKEAGVLK